MLVDLYEASSIVALPATPPVQAVVVAIPFDRFAAELLDLYGPRLRAAGTRRAVAHALRLLAELGVERTDDLTTGVIGRLVETRPTTLSRTRIRTILRQVQVICNHAVGAGYLRISPFARRKVSAWVRPSAPIDNRHLTRDEVRRILDVLALDVASKQGFAGWQARRLQALVALVAFTGLRKGEALFLQTADLNLPNRVLDVVDRAAHRLKTERSEQPVALPDGELVPILESWLAHRDDSPPDIVRRSSPYVFRNWENSSPWTGGCPGHKPLDRLRAIGDRAGVPDATFQALRRSVATLLEGNGASAEQITRQLRHTSTRTAERYYRRADVASMRKVIDGLHY